MDLFVEDGDKAMIVEVKSKLTTEDITDHVERMEKVRAHADLHEDRRVFLGAIAAMIIDDKVKRFALKNGFYVLEPSGETFKIIVPEGDCSPREWR
jgi:putative heme iron utilization protein